MKDLKRMFFTRFKLKLSEHDVKIASGVFRVIETKKRVFKGLFLGLFWMQLESYFILNMHHTIESYLNSKKLKTRLQGQVLNKL